MSPKARRLRARLEALWTRIKHLLRQFAIYACITTGLLVLYILSVDNFFMPFLVDVEQVRVPPLADLPVDRARAKLQQMGLRFSVADTVFSDLFAADHIVDQTPEAGRQVKRGRRVAVSISRGQRLYTAPDLRGSSLRDARLRIEGSQLTFGRLTYRSSETLPEGAVLSQTPAPGQPLPRGGRMDLVVSSGSPRLPKAVPALIGLRIGSVEDSLDKYELALGQITERVDNEVPAGTVLSQSVPPDSRALPHTPIDLTLSVRALPDDAASPKARP